MAHTSPNVFPAGIKPFAERPLPKTICMFDVDMTLSIARQQAKPEMFETLKKLRETCATAIVSGSDLSKIEEQLTNPATKEFLSLYDYVFAENGLSAFKLGKPLASASFIGYVGEEQYKNLVNFILRYLSEVDIPLKRGTFIEYRTGMINVSPIGRNCSQKEREDFNAFDQEHSIRPKMVKALEDKFGHLGLTFAIGGQISFDVFPTGWDKTYSLRHVEPEGFTDIHFYGDKTSKGGNDYEIFSDERTVGHTVINPDDTIKQLNEQFLSKQH